jgi:hypothetical protein
MAVAEPVSMATIFLVVGSSRARTLMKRAAADNFGSGYEGCPGRDVRGAKGDLEG